MRLPSSLLLCALSAAATVRAEPPAEEAAPQPSATHARLTLGETLGLDSGTNRLLSFSDLRVVADSSALFDSGFSLSLDGRARRAWSDVRDDRASVTEAALRYDTAGAWRLGLGRQLVRPLASAQVDGIAVEHRLSPGTLALAFAGLAPHPVTGVFDERFATAGLGYEANDTPGSHAGGAVVTTYAGALDRAYVTQRSYRAFSRALVLSGFALVDLNGSERGLDLTTFSGLVRYRPATWVMMDLALSHNHTILPSRWWADWLAAERRRRGFVIDGDEPVGTRISSVRLTHDFELSGTSVPYVRLRYDRRHTEEADGEEGRVGWKWRPGDFVLDASYAYRAYFGADTMIADLHLGIDRPAGGAELAATGFSSNGQDGAVNLHAAAWLVFGDMTLLGQYDGFFEPAITYHAFFVQVGYRLDVRNDPPAVADRAAGADSGSK